MRWFPGAEPAFSPEELQCRSSLAHTRVVSWRGLFELKGKGEILKLGRRQRAGIQRSVVLLHRSAIKVSCRRRNNHALVESELWLFIAASNLSLLVIAGVKGFGARWKSSGSQEENAAQPNNQSI